MQGMDRLERLRRYRAMALGLGTAAETSAAALGAGHTIMDMVLLPDDWRRTAEDWRGAFAEWLNGEEDPGDENPEAEENLEDEDPFAEDVGYEDPAGEDPYGEEDPWAPDPDLEDFWGD